MQQFYEFPEDCMTHLRAAGLCCLVVDCCNENVFLAGVFLFVFFSLTRRFYLISNGGWWRIKSANLWLNNDAYGFRKKDSLLFTAPIQHWNKWVREQIQSFFSLLRKLCHMSKLKYSSCCSSASSLSLHSCVFPLERHLVPFLQLASIKFLASWLADWRIGSGLKVWHCHNVGGDETALRLTLLDFTWLALSGRRTFHPPPIDRRENYSKGETIYM